MVILGRMFWWRDALVNARTAQRAQTPIACRVPGCKEIPTRRLASRIWPREGGCIATDVVFADYSWLR
jgi:hypothetical protein